MNVQIFAALFLDIKGGFVEIDGIAFWCFLLFTVYFVHDKPIIQKKIVKLYLKLYSVGYIQGQTVGLYFVYMVQLWIVNRTSKDRLER